MPIGMPGWPELAFWTASIASARIALAILLVGSVEVVIIELSRSWNRWQCGRARQAGCGLDICLTNYFTRPMVQELKLRCTAAQRRCAPPHLGCPHAPFLLFPAARPRPCRHAAGSGGPPRQRGAAGAGRRHHAVQRRRRRIHGGIKQRREKARQRRTEGLQQARRRAALRADAGAGPAGGVENGLDRREGDRTGRGGHPAAGGAPLRGAAVGRACREKTGALAGHHRLGVRAERAQPPGPAGRGRRLQGLDRTAGHAPPHQALTLMVGPEGGFTEEEENLALAHGALALSMGPRILRTETAGLTALAALNAIWGGM